VLLNAPLEAAVKGVKKNNPLHSSTPMINGALMFQRMEEQRELAQAMKKRALQMYEEACVMAEKCRSIIHIR
jgi:hypothetical protein